LSISSNRVEDNGLSKSNKVSLTNEELKLYGTNRFLKGYQKIQILGRGGCAVVYLA
jgi:hypothetical protein